MARHLTFPLVGLAKRSSSVRWLARFMAGWYWFSVPIASILAPQPRIMPSYTSPDRPCVSQPKLHARRDSATIPHLHVELHALATRKIIRGYAAPLPFGHPFAHVPAQELGKR